MNHSDLIPASKQNMFGTINAMFRIFFVIGQHEKKIDWQKEWEVCENSADFFVTTIFIDAFIQFIWGTSHFFC